VLRDFRTGDMHEIDPHLMDYLVAVAAELGKEARFSVISGYRSPETNAKLHERSAGVAQHSLHMQGRAIDVRMAGIDCADLAAHAESLQRGGVGYYRASISYTWTPVPFAPGVDSAWKREDSRYRPPWG
jgi:uncharacterized protein YcbK (DUF882 family)